MSRHSAPLHAALTAALLAAFAHASCSAAALSQRPDFDGSGTTDLVWRNTAYGQTALWLMNGASASASSFVMNDPAWAVVATGDFNGDGKSDLVWRHAATGQTVIWLMNGTTMIASAFVMNDPSWEVVHVADFDNDGRSDLLWRNAATGATAMWLMNGLAASKTAFLLSDPAWMVTHTADLDGDGKADLVWRNTTTGATAVWLMNGTAATASAIVMTDPQWFVTVTGDFDGNGRADLVWRHATSGVTALTLMNGAAITSTTFLTGDASWNVALTADLDGDGKSDLVWSNSTTGETAIWLMNGSVAANTAVVLTDPSWSVTQSGDYNHDGKADLLFEHAVTGQSAIWLMSGLTPTASAFLGDRTWSVRYDDSVHDYRAAARFLAHATFGSSREEIARVAQIGPDAWLAEQFATPATSFTSYVYPLLIGGADEWAVNSPAIWRQIMQGPDQLRLRVAFALSEILVVSLENGNVQDAYCGPTSYLDTLGEHAFGNFQNLLKAVTLHPVMGEYLNMKGSAKTDPTSGQQPNENFAREMLQLFSIGTVMLNQDGSAMRDGAGHTIPTYDQSVVQSFAKAYSGWTFAGQDQTKTWRWLFPDTWDTDHTLRVQKACPAWSQPMQPWLANYRSADNTRDIAGPAHDASAKQLLQYTGAVSATLPAGQTPMQDIDGAIANIFNHPNVGPFIARQLIQRLVTSTPSPAYVSRVAATFNNNRSGVRGDMKAVVTAILRDPEATGIQFTRRPKWGKLREPVIRFAQGHRAFQAAVNNADGYYEIWSLSDASDLAQDVMRAPSVFNFFSPRYAPSAAFGADGASAPEFQIATTDSVSGYADFSRWGIIGGFRSWDANAAPSYWIKPDYSYYTGIAGNARQLVRELDLLMAEGMLDPTFKAALVASLNKITPDASGLTERFKTALWLLLNTPDGVIQK